MNQILSGDDIIKTILGIQTWTRDETYRLLSFCLFSEIGNGYLLYNNLTKELLHLPSQIDSLSLDEKKALVEHWFLVPYSFDDHLFAKQLTALSKDIYSNRGHKSFTILSTTDCNARCFYCFEKSCPRINMTPETAKAVTAFILKHSKPTDKLSIRWFGGEPLYNSAAIDVICDELSQKRAFTSSIVTNGFLLSTTMLSHALEKWNLKSIQITLDGTENTYNKTKAFIYPNTNAYQIVLNNIIAISNSAIDLHIRLNIDLYNAEDLFSLVRELSSKIQNKSRISIAISPLFELAGAYPNIREKEARETLYKVINQLHNYISEQGFLRRYRLPQSIRFHNCVADSDDSIVINPDGALYRCEHINGLDAIATIYDDLPSLGYGKWTKLFPETPLCSNCPLYADCFRLEKCKEHTLCIEEFRNYQITQLYDAMIYEYNLYLKKKEESQ